jgi:glycosyltransferase involved in cell wall biosynthesis
LVAKALETDGHDVRIAGPRRKPGRSLARVGLGPIVASASIPRGEAGWRPDVLITNGLLGGISRATVPTIHVFHGTMIAHAKASGPTLPLRQRVREAVGGGIAEALSARAAHVNVAVSEAAAREARRFYGVRRVAVVENGVDTATFRPQARSAMRELLGLSPTARVAVFVGRAEARKAPEVALAACQSAGFDLLVAGPEPIAGGRHLGTLDPHSLAQYYAASDCVMFPSRYEACSYVILEALACGVPVVTTPVGWIQTLLRCVPTYEALIAHPDPIRMASILSRLDSPSSVAAVAAASRWTREHNSLNTFSVRWRDLVDSVLTEDGSATRSTPRGSKLAGHHFGSAHDPLEGAE